jgi:uncharacterized protein
MVTANHREGEVLMHRNLAALAAVALMATLIPATAFAAGDGITINEIRIDQPSTDDDEYFELTGEPGASLDGLTYLVIGDGTGGSGVIEAVVDLTGQSLDSNGIFVAAEGTFTLGAADLTTNLNFENSDNFTHLLVQGFTGSTGDDLDTDDEGTLDVTPWSDVVDLIALVEEENPPTGTEFHYGPPAVGPDGSNVPGHVYDCVDDGWQIGGFDPGTEDTPGEVNVCDASPPPDPIELSISEVQGPGGESPHDGVLVTVEGVVVGDYQGDGENQLGGFNLQEEADDQDDDPATSEGIFVFAPFAPDVAIGDVVSVTGTVDEFGGMTEITDVTDVTMTGTAPGEVTAVEVSLPVTDPTEWEPNEGMLVTFPQVLFISEFFNFDRFGEIVLTTERQYQGTHVAEPGEAANAVAEANALARITLDDTRTHQNPETVIHPDGEPFTLDHTFRGGDTLQGVTGTMHFGSGLYRIQPAYFDQGAIEAPTYDNANPRPTSPDPIEGDVRVASFNVLNFFTHIDDGPDICGPTGNLDCRGADTQEEFDRQLAKLVAGIIALDADIVGIQEVENDILDEGDDGDRPHNPVLTLVEALNSAEGSEVWAWAGEANHYNDYPVRNEIIYRVDEVEPVGDPIALADDAFDSAIPGNIEPVGRPPLAQTFRQIVDQGSVQPFTVVVNHFKSKGSSCASIGDPDLGDGQAHCNLTRVAQSEALLGFVDALSEESSGVVVIGDLNSYAREDPIDTLKEGGLTELVAEFEGADAYSFVFDGQLGYLDTALATRSMLNWVSGLTTFHINADEPDILDYDTTFKSVYQASLYEPLPYRVSDHDPVIIGLTFGGPDENK